ncbi:MAG TPA: hypothetical protein VGC07_03990 [Granulicella sp.]
MTFRFRRWILLPVPLLLTTVCSAQVFVVGEKSATADIATDFTPTRVSLPSEPLSERGRRELVRNLEAEQGFAHRALPMGDGLSLEANGQIHPGAEEYKRMIFRKGESAAPGDRIVITSVMFKPDRIIMDLNGGPYAKHRFLRHVSFNDMPVVQPQTQLITGARVTLTFEGGVPEISAAEVKALLVPVLDFGVKTSGAAYAETLPTPLKDAIATHDVLVGMNHRMVLAALGAPESKVREHEGSDPDAPRYEEWIYGHVPQTVRFIRFQGDRVSQVKIAAMGKPIEIHNADETEGLMPDPEVREIALGDKQSGDENSAARVAPPSLRKPGEPEPANAEKKVQLPQQKSDAKPNPTTAQTAPPTLNQ